MRRPNVPEMEFGGTSGEMWSEVDQLWKWHASVFDGIKLLHEEQPITFEGWIATPGGETYQEYLQRREPSA